jgi:hypothetical protein
MPNLKSLSDKNSGLPFRESKVFSSVLAVSIREISPWDDAPGRIPQGCIRKSWEASQKIPKLGRPNVCKCAVVCQEVRWPECSGDHEMSRARMNEGGSSGPFRWYAPDLSGGDSIRLACNSLEVAIPKLAESRCCRLKVYLHMSSACQVRRCSHLKSSHIIVWPLGAIQQVHLLQSVRHAIDTRGSS